jgi:hypothetical protein
MCPLLGAIGCKRWKLSFLADRLVELEVVDSWF